MKSNKSKIKTIQPLLVSLPETRIEKCSRAGKVGSAARWKDHIKVQTTLIRVLKNDADSFTRLASLSSSSVATVVHSLLEHSSDYIRTSKCSQVNS